MTLGEFVDLIILFAAFCGAIYKIWDFFAKPTSKLKQKSLEREKERIGAVIDEKMPAILYNHDLETRDKYKSDREKDGDLVEPQKKGISQKWALLKWTFCSVRKESPKNLAISINMT